MLSARSHLQGLRLNCLLAVFLPIGLAASALIALGHWHRHIDQQQGLLQAKLFSDPTSLAWASHPYSRSARRGLCLARQRSNGMALLS